MTYEYKMIETAFPPEVELLNDMALDNWELVSVSEFQVHIIRYNVYFKRIT